MSDTVQGVPSIVVDDRTWQLQAIRRLRAEQASAQETQLLEITLANAPGIRLFLKDETGHPSGSLKHRLARSLILNALCNGWIGPKSLIVEASSGSTAVSAAWFAAMLGLRFMAVIPASTAPEKVAEIKANGGECVKVEDPCKVQSEAARIAAEAGGYFLDQFTFAERASDWRGDDNIARRTFDQLEAQGAPAARWVVCGAGTGGTAATFGRHIRYKSGQTGLCVADPEASVFHRHYADRSITSVDGPVSCIEGIGRPRMVPSFIPELVDRMIVVPDKAGIAAAHYLSDFLDRACGPSTGANLHACMELIDEMVRRNESGSVVSLICDSGERYRSTSFCPSWCQQREISDADTHPLMGHFIPMPHPRAAFG